MTKEYFLRLYEHAIWANRRVLGLLRKQSQENERARILFNHVLSAEQVWMTRLCGRDSSALPIWPHRSLDECAALMEENYARYQQFLNDLTEENLGQEVAYKNSQGQEFHTPVGDILTQVAFHGAYHRGQIATVVRDAGGEPINTDFITFARETA
jgi:uncharacterized damage-inducible protein DinB